MIHTLSKDGFEIVAIYQEIIDIASPRTIELFENCLECILCLRGFGSRDCRCDPEENPLLAYFHERDFGVRGAFYGIYGVDERDWKAIDSSLKADILRARRRRKQLVRYENRSSIEAIQSWIDSDYPDANLIVKPLTIPAVAPPKNKQKKLTHIYTECFRGSESRLHGYLKWFAYFYLSKGEASHFYAPIQLGGIGFEVTYALPGNRILKEYTRGKGQVVPKEWLARGHGQGSILKVADVYSDSRRIVVECGAVDSMSLVSPVVAKVAKSAIWLPYPETLNRNEEVDEFDFGCTAYVIHRRQPAHLQRKND